MCSIYLHVCGAVPKCSWIYKWDIYMVTQDFIDNNHALIALKNPTMAFNYYKLKKLKINLKKMKYILNHRTKNMAVMLGRVQTKQKPSRT